MKNSEYHANDVTAFDSFSTNLIGSVIGLSVILIVSLLFWDYGYITNVGLILGGSIIAASNMNAFTSNTNAFNKYKVTRSSKK